MINWSKSHKKWLAGILSILLIFSLSISLVPQAREKASDILTIGTNQVTKFLTIGTETAYAAQTPDYTCDGTADDVQFQAALGALDSSGGEIYILAGDYNFTATVSRAIDDVTIRGVGNSVYIAYNASTALFSAGSQDGWIFQDFTTDAGGVTYTSATTLVENVYVNGTSTNEISGDVDFNGYEAIAMSCQHGSTFPTSPTDGMWFRHQPTGRDILYMYYNSGSTWKPIYSFGTITLYVDSSDGTDDLVHGTGVNSDAFTTIQYALNFIPKSSDGSAVYIYINDEAYAEDLAIPNLPNTIYMYGTLTSIASGTMSANGLQGATSNHGYFTDTGNLSGVANKLAYLDADGDYRIIDTTDGNTATIVGYFTSQPLSSENYVVYDWGTTITSISSIAKGVYLYDLSVGTVTGNINVQVDMERCEVTTRISSHATIHFNYSIINSGTNQSFSTTEGGLSLPKGSKFRLSISGNPLFVTSNAIFVFSTVPSVIELAGGGTGVWIVQNSSCGFGNLYNKIYYSGGGPSGTGVYAGYGGMGIYTTNNQYSNLTTNENPASASYGYID